MKKRIIAISIIIILLLIIVCISLRETILKKVYVIDYSEYVEKYSNQYNVDKYLIYSIIKAESNFNENAVSSKGAKGLMQLMYPTAEEIAKKSDIEISEETILEPDVNINLGTKYISMLLQKYKCIELALAAYNAGSGNVDSWIEDGTLQDDGSDIENVPYKETNNYVRKILNNYEVYKDLYTEE